MPKTIKRDWFYMPPFILCVSSVYYDVYGLFLQVLLQNRDLRLSKGYCRPEFTYNYRSETIYCIRLSFIYHHEEFFDDFRVLIFVL